jgi:hypothetical protein
MGKRLFKSRKIFVLCKKVCILLERVIPKRVICDSSMKNPEDTEFYYLING